MSGGGDVLKGYIEKAIDDLRQAEKAINETKDKGADILRRVIGESICGFRNVQRLIDYRMTGWNLLMRVCQDEGGDREWKTQKEKQQSGFEFDHLRHLACQSYVNSLWSLADVLAGVAGTIIHLKKESRGTGAAKLHRDFLGDGKTGLPTLSAMLSSVAGESVSILYAIRNHFVHDGMQQTKEAERFFKNDSPGSGMVVNKEAWKSITDSSKRGQGSKTTPDSTDSKEKDETFVDLRNVFEAHVPNMDHTLGILACYAARSALTMAQLIPKSPPSISPGENDALQPTAEA